MATGITSMFWHGGIFKNEANGDLVYEGGKGRTFDTDPNLVCWWDLLELAKKCGDYEKVGALYYLVPGRRLINGLVRIVEDKDAVELGKVAMNNRCVEIYVLHGDKLPNLQENPTEPVLALGYWEKLKPRRGPQNTGPTKKDAATSSTHSNPNSVNKSKSNPLLDNSTSQQLNNSPLKTTPATKTVAPTAKPPPKAKIPAVSKTLSKTNPPKAKIHAVSKTLSKTIPPKAHPVPQIDKSKSKSEPQKTHPHSTKTSFLDAYEWIDPRPEHPLTWDELISDFNDGSDSDDPNFELELGKHKSRSVGGENSIDDDDDEFTDLEEEDIHLLLSPLSSSALVPPPSPSAMSACKSLLPPIFAGVFGTPDIMIVKLKEKRLW
ncbi:hypothetical protein BVRB_7g179810 [Beta vulgaris subsp. vulgaris]|uniref:PB1-like domain-containing protein n=1 Tax=Beta vulgaris subsp. vulgaris TaxID=3555 RepID=A0A0J8BAI3_BETVV|nr:hypothetical protein BVRB_7g179810 [Beta vulgaris subsp. vulgaris]